LAASRYPNNATWKTAALYINTEYKAKPNFTFLSGLRYSHVWINSVFDTSLFPFPFKNANLSTGALTGSLGLSWFPQKNLQITWNASTGFRSPNIDDVGKIFDSEPGAVVVPNPDLEPEYAYNVELGIHKNWKDKLVLKGAVFYTYLVDALVRRDFLFNGESEIVYNGELSRVKAIQNAAKAYVYGFEIGLDAYVTDHFSLTGNLTINKGVEEEEDGTESPARHVAPTFADFHIIWKNQKLKTDLFLNYNGKISSGNLATSEKSKKYIYALDTNGNPFAASTALPAASFAESTALPAASTAPLAAPFAASTALPAASTAPSAAPFAASTALPAASTAPSAAPFAASTAPVAASPAAAAASPAALAAASVASFALSAASLHDTNDALNATIKIDPKITFFIVSVF